MLPYSTLRVEGEVGRGALEVRSIGEETFETYDMMACGTIDERVCAAGVIADHTTNTATVGRGCLG